MKTYDEKNYDLESLTTVVSNDTVLSDYAKDQIIQNIPKLWEDHDQFIALCDELGLNYHNSYAQLWAYDYAVTMNASKLLVNLEFRLKSTDVIKYFTCIWFYEIVVNSEHKPAIIKKVYSSYTVNGPEIKNKITADTLPDFRNKLLNWLD